MHNFEFYWPVKFLAGSGEFKKAGIEAKKLGRKALIVTGRSSAKKLGFIEDLVDQLKNENIGVVLFDKVQTNPRSTVIDEGGKLAREKECDLIIGLGGGSPMDAAKAIALVARSEKGVSIWDYMFCVKNPKPITVTPLPVLLIPTLPATGSESNQTAVITNWELHQKTHLMHPSLFPKTSIVDPELTLSLSGEQIAYAGVDIVCHLLEPYITNTGDAVVKDRMAEGLIFAAIKNSTGIIGAPHDIEARMNLCWAGTMACSPFRFMSWNGKGYLHWMEHCLSAHTDVPHSEGLAMLLPAWLRYMSNYAFIKERLVTVGERLFDFPEGAIDMLVAWQNKIGVKTRLEGVEDYQIEKMCDTLMEVYSGGRDYIALPSEERMTREDFKKIYQNARNPGV